MSIQSDLATENYLKAIVKALADPAKERIGTGELARLLEVTPGTATVMLKKLERLGFVEYASHRGCALTNEGRAYGLRVLRRHRLLESFLVQVLGLDWSAGHAEAENLEHAASERLIDEIDRFLGQPERDPNGDPIPAKNQSEYSVDDMSLASCVPGQRVRIRRISGDEGQWAYYRRQGLVPGALVRVVARDAAAALMTLELGSTQLSFARKIVRNNCVGKGNNCFHKSHTIEFP